MTSLRTGKVGVVFACLLGLPACAAVLRIDGRSDAAFNRTHTQLVESLSPQDRLRLSLAEIIVLEPLHCLTMAPIPGQPQLTAIVGGQAVVKTCRHELHGMSFQDIMRRAYPDPGAEKERAVVPPNASLQADKGKPSRRLHEQTAHQPVFAAELGR